MEQKKVFKLEKAEFQNMIYPAIFGVIMVLALLIFGLSLRFLFKSVSDILFVGSGGGASSTRFQTENLSTIRHHLPDLPQQ